MLRFISLQYSTKTCDGKALHWKSYDNMSIFHLENILLITYYICLWFFRPTRDCTRTWRCHHCRWKAANFDRGSALMAIEQWVCSWHTYCEAGQPFIMVISKDPWYSYLLPKDKQWSCHYLFLRHRSLAAGIRTANLQLASRNSTHSNAAAVYSLLYTYFIIWWCVYQWIEIILTSCLLCSQCRYSVRKPLSVVL